MEVNSTKKTSQNENAEEEILIKDELTSDDLFSLFVSKGEDLLEVIDLFNQLCESLNINTRNYKTVYQSLTSKLTSWKCKNLWNKIDKKAKHVDYKNKPCAKLKTAVIGAGPCGLRAAIELALLGAEVIVIEKRNSFSRNNVLHLWPFLIVDLKSLGAKVFYGKFCAGSLDHISIRKLQVILLKVCLLLGVQIYPETSFEEVVEPTQGRGWRLKTSPSHPEIWDTDIDSIVAADGKRNTLKGFKMKEFRGKLAIGITVNFVNKSSQQEAAMEEISGVAFIYNQQFFQELKDKTGIDLENIVYYKDDTHYFVMTAKKKSLLAKGVIKEDNADAKKLLTLSNVDHESLLQYAREAVDFSTEYKLPHHEFALNHYGKEDVAMFDFTSMHAAENASRIVERKGKRLLMNIVGDTLIEPFWPTGSGCARGFLGVFDAAWAVRSFGLGRDPLDIIQERESILRLLAQTKPGNMTQDYSKYSIDPSTRYPNCNTKSLKKQHVKHLFDKSDINFKDINYETDSEEKVANSPRTPVNNTGIDAYRLLKWCQEQTKEYPGVKIVDMAISWKNGLGFAAIIHRYRPDIIDFFTLDDEDAEKNCQLAFDAAEEHLGIPPKMSGKDFTSTAVPDRLTVISYLSLYYDVFKGDTPAFESEQETDEKKSKVWKSLTAFAIVGTNNNAKDKPPGSPRKSPMKSNKMSIIARLSRRSKKKVKEFRKQKIRGKDKENVIDSTVQLKKYTKTDKPATDKQHLISSGSEPSSPEHQATNTPETVEPPNQLQPAKIEDTNKEEASRAVTFAVAGTTETSSDTDKKTDSPSQSKRTSKINMLAETVFGVPTKQAVAEAETTLSVSEVCYFCKRRVYVMERMSAEGMFFHRQCFRCNVCKCKLLLGSYAFEAEDDSAAGKFYCKIHYNRMIYNTPREKEKKSEPVKNPDQPRKDRPTTLVIQPTPMDKAFPVSTTEKKIPGMDRERSNSDVTSIRMTNRETDVIFESRGSPYDKFQAKALVRHPSLTRQQSKTLSSPTRDAGLMHSAMSTPALQKIFNEDNELGEDLRKRAELKDSSEGRRRHLRKLKPDPELQKAIEDDLNRDDDFIPGRPSTPENTKKRLVPADLKLDLRSLLNDEDIDELNPDGSGMKKVDVGINDGLKESSKIVEKTKKKKFVLKRKKEKKKETEVIPEEKETMSSPELARAVSPSIADQEMDTSLVEPTIRVAESKTDDSTDSTTNVSSRITNDSTADVDDITTSVPTKVSTDADTSLITENTIDVTSENIINKTVSSEQSSATTDIDAVAPTENTPSDVKTDSKKEELKTKKKSKTKKEKSERKEKEKKKKKTRKEKKKMAEEEEPGWVIIDVKDEGVENSRVKTDESGSSDQEDSAPKSQEGFFSRVLGTKPKRVLKTAEEIEEEERKQKRKELKKIQQAANERRLKRLWEAQSIQRKLHEVEVKQVELDENAKLLERKLRRPYLKPEEEGPLMLEWFQIVNDKNVLLRFESELVIQGSNIQLEDQQARLEADIRALLTSDDPKSEDQEWIQVLTKELVDTVEQRNNLVVMLEEDRIRELEEDKNLQELMADKAKDLGLDRLI